jgi:hypothetical protein
MLHQVQDNPIRRRARQFDLVVVFPNRMFEELAFARCLPLRSPPPLNSTGRRALYALPMEFNRLTNLAQAVPAGHKYLKQRFQSPI